MPIESMNRSMTGTIRINRLRLKEMETRLSYLHPRHKLQEQQQRLVELEDELRQLMDDRVKGSKISSSDPDREDEWIVSDPEAESGIFLCRRSGWQCDKEYPASKKGDELTVYVTDGLIQTSVEAVQNKTYEI